MVDIVVEITDARIPQSSRNPEIDRMLGQKPRLILLNKCDVADPNLTARWCEYYRSKGILAIPTDCKSCLLYTSGLQAIRLDVYEENRTAIGFYETCGYHCCGRIDLGLEEVYGLKWYYAYEKLL